MFADIITGQGDWADVFFLFALIVAALTSVFFAMKAINSTAFGAALGASLALVAAGLLCF